jgi:hypothetical protein
MRISCLTAEGSRNRRDCDRRPRLRRGTHRRGLRALGVRHVAIRARANRYGPPDRRTPARVAPGPPPPARNQPADFSACASVTSARGMPAGGRSGSRGPSDPSAQLSRCHAPAGTRAASSSARNEAAGTLTVSLQATAITYRIEQADPQPGRPDVPDLAVGPPSAGRLLVTGDEIRPRPPGGLLCA